MEQHSIAVVMKRLQRFTLRQGMGSGTSKAPTSKLKSLALKAKKVRCHHRTGPRGFAGDTTVLAIGNSCSKLESLALKDKRAFCLLLRDLIH